MENYNITADEYADLFSDFYSENSEVYGEDMEAAYADFEVALNEEIEAEQFEAYYSEAGDIYEDTEEGFEEAYADFISFKEGSETEEEEDEFSEEDQDFLDFYSETEDIYGDNIEEAYADFVEFTSEDEYASKEEKKNKRNQVIAVGAMGGLYGASSGATIKYAHNAAKNNGELKKRIKELTSRGIANLSAAEHAELDDAKKKSRLFFPRYNKDNYKGVGKAALIGGATGATLGTAGAALHNYSEEDFDNDFMDFYSEAESLYEGDVEEAFSDFTELMEEEYGVKDVVSKIGTSLAKAGKSVKNAGSKAFDKTQKFIHTHIAEPGATRHALHHGSYADEEEEVEEEVYSDEEYLTLDEFSDGFAEFYSEQEDVYGDSDEDLEEAYDDYSDLVAEQELELMFSEDDSDEDDREYGFVDKVKGYAGKAKGFVKGNTLVKGAGIGAGAGLAAGLIAGSVGKDAKERKALKAKGDARTAEETARYNELKKSRRNKIIGGTLGGAALGAGAGYAKDKGLFNKKKSVVDATLALPGKATLALGEAKDKVASAEDLEDSKSKDKTFSTVDLLGKPGQFNLGSMKSNSTEDRNFSGTDKNESKIGSSILSILGK